MSRFRAQNKYYLQFRSNIFLSWKKNDFSILIFFQNVRDFFTEILFFKHFQKIRDFSDFQKIRFFQILTFSGNNKNMSRFDATFLE